jgi:hypothetical protein
VGKQVGQAANRRHQVWEEVGTGREWESSVDIKDRSQAPASPVSPLFTAPVMPSPHYVEQAPGKRYGFVQVRYDTWLQDLEQAWKDRSETLDRIARAMAGRDDILYAKLVAEPTAAILGQLGPEPLNQKYVLACEAGDRWALGLDPWDGTPETMPRWARKLWPDGVIEKGRAARTDRRLDFLYEDEDDLPDAEPMRPRKNKGGRPRKNLAVTGTVAAPANPIDAEFGME